MIDENSKLRALISNNFGRRKNNPAKDRKALAIYVELKGYKNGMIGNGRKKEDHNGLATLDEIAKELNMSKTNLKRALRIERNLTDSMKKLLDTGEITKTFASDTIASLSEEEQEELISSLVDEIYLLFKGLLLPKNIDQYMKNLRQRVVGNANPIKLAAKEIGIKMVPIRIRENLIDEDKKLKVLLAANFQRPKNSEAKQRKVADEYVRLCGYSANGDRTTECQNGTRLTLEEIATQLGTSKRDLQRALRIERNLTDSMKELLDNGVITKTLASDTIASLSEEEQEELISKLKGEIYLLFRELLLLRSIDLFMKSEQRNSNQKLEVTKNLKNIENQFSQI